MIDPEYKFCSPQSLPGDLRLAVPSSALLTVPESKRQRRSLFSYWYLKAVLVLTPVRIFQC